MVRVYRVLIMINAVVTRLLPTPEGGGIRRAEVR